MKLPKEVADYETPFNIAFAKAIVNDCASICLSTELKLEPHKYPSDAERHLIYVVEIGVRNAIAAAILARYGLEPKP